MFSPYVRDDLSAHLFDTTYYNILPLITSARFNFFSYQSVLQYYIENFASCACKLEAELDISVALF